MLAKKKIYIYIFFFQFIFLIQITGKESKHLEKTINNF